MFFEQQLVINWSVLAVLVIVAFWVHRKLAGHQDRFKFFGHKSEAMFDLWSVQHFLSGIIVVWLIFQKGPWTGFIDKFGWLLAVCFIAYLWEFIEIFMEAGYFGKTIAIWKDGFEHWSNRFISDPLTAVLGGIVYIEFTWIIWPALVLNILWFILNVRRKHSMEIQEKFIQLFQR
ncbi:MAG: hypothetical protein NTV81_04200 [Candidatus Komeilibacteria bacterium]|nr:hypothetical protein [Candidatus Komeilibacteria bacterium]